MIGANAAAEFWAAVQDCLVQFHNMPAKEAALKVTETWRRISNVSIPPSPSDALSGEVLIFEDMIYHEEPWYVACNIANTQKDLGQYWMAYEQVLRNNHLG